MATVAEFRAFFQQIDPAFDDTPVVLPGCDPEEDTFHPATVWEAEVVRVRGRGLCAAVTVGVELSHVKNQNRVLNPGGRTRARLGREVQMARAA